MNEKKINCLNVYFCRECKMLDYAKDKCPRCGSADIAEANLDFLLFENVISMRDKTYIGNIIKI